MLAFSTTSCTLLMPYMTTTEGYKYTKTKLTYQYVGTGMSIGTGEAEASSRPGTSPGDDREDREDEHLEAVYMRERDMENSPRDSTASSRGATSPERMRQWGG